MRKAVFKLIVAAGLFAAAAPVQAEVRILASSIQVVPEDHGWEKWMNIPHERERLYKLINETKAAGLFIISQGLVIVAVVAGADIIVNVVRGVTGGGGKTGGVPAAPEVPVVPA